MSGPRAHQRCARSFRGRGAGRTSAQASVVVGDRADLDADLPRAARSPAGGVGSAEDAAIAFDDPGLHHLALLDLHDHSADREVADAEEARTDAGVAVALPIAGDRRAEVVAGPGVGGMRDDAHPLAVG